MRLAAPDILLFVVGLVLFAGAGYALVQEGGAGVLGGPSSATGVYSVSYDTDMVEVGSVPVPNFQAASPEFQVNATNVARVVVNVRCTDAVPGGTFNLRVEVTGPNVTAPPATGTCGSAIEVSVPVADVPPATTVQGSTAEDAEASLSNENATKAQGRWKVAVTGTRGGTPVGGLPGPAAPTGTIVLSVERWTPTLAPVVK